MSKPRNDKRRLNRIENVYRTLGIESAEVRRYLVGLGSLGNQTEKEKPPIFIQAGTTSLDSVRPANAGLERAAE